MTVMEEPARIAGTSLAFNGSRIRANALVHLTQGHPASRAGRNLRALCGTSVRPDAIGTGVGFRLCRECRQCAERYHVEIKVVEPTS